MRPNGAIFVKSIVMLKLSHCVIGVRSEDAINSIAVKVAVEDQKALQDCDFYTVVVIALRQGW
jgi:hypothetical protein